MAEPRFDVVVCTHDRDRLPGLRRCLGAVRAQLRDGDRCLLVVDGPTDLAEDLRTDFADVEVLVNGRGPGLAGARNTGVQAGRNDVVLFLDDDAVPRPGWAEAYRRRFVDGRVDVVGGAVRPDWAGAGAPRWFPAEFGWVVGCDYPGMPPHGAPIRNPIGASMGIRRTAFARAGLFDESLGRVGAGTAGGEETELAIRIGGHPGARLVRDTDTAVDHVVPAARRRIGYLTRRCLGEGRSKAAVCGRAGARAGLRSERAHVARTLPRSWARSLVELLRGDGWAAARLLVSLAGLALTVLGYGYGRLRPARPTAPAAAADTRMSVVLCTLGRSAHLPAALDALRGQTLTDLDIVVVDNDPASDALDRALAETADPRVRIVREPRRGLSVARNTGVRAARGHLVAFTDDDAEPAPDWAERILTAFAAGGPELVGVTGRVRPAELRTDPHRWFERGLGFDQGERSRTWTLTPGGDGADDPLLAYTAGRIGSGNNMAFRRSWLLATGGFDELLGAGTPARGGEDLAVLRRGLLGGGTIRYEPAAVVHHHHRETLGELTGQAFAWGCGMAAQLTRYALTDPAAFGRIARRVPRGLAVLLAPGSSKNRDRPADYPRRLVWAERAGYLAGPLLLLVGALRRGR